MKVEGCYASVLNDCEGPLSREHIISQAMLGEVMKANVGEKEFDFLKGDFVVRNLCVRHNNSFRKAESHFAQFRRFIFETSQLWSTINKRNENELSSLLLPRKFRVKGEYLEKWMVKTVVNYCYFMNDMKKPNLNFRYISNRLFKNEEFKFEFPYGLSLLHPKSELTSLYPGQIYFDIIRDLNDEIGGVIVNLEGYLFLVLFPSENSHTITRNGVHFHGEEFQFGDQSISWHGAGYRQNQFSADKKTVTRSEIFMRW